MSEARYDLIGRGYRQVRRPDPQIAARLEAALGEAAGGLGPGGPSARRSAAVRGRQLRCRDGDHHQMDDAEVEQGLNALQADLESGRWDKRNGHLRDTPELDLGLRLLLTELS